MRDKDKSKYLGKGVEKAVANVNSIIAPAVIAASLNPVRWFQNILKVIDEKFVCLFHSRKTKQRLMI